MFSLKAVTNIIDVMSVYDRISFITYDNEATVVFENGSIEYRDYLLEQMHHVEAGGGTNIEAALNAAKDLLLRSGDETRR